MIVSKRTSYFAVALVSALIAQVGCGGSNNHREPIGRGLPAGATTTAVEKAEAARVAAAKLLADKVAASHSGQPATPGSSTADQFTALQAKFMALHTSEGIVEVEMSKLLGQGTYTLTKVSSSYHYQGTSEYVGNFDGAVTFPTADHAEIADQTGSAVLGTMTGDDDTVGAQMEIPVRFSTAADGSLVANDTKALVSNLLNKNVEATASDMLNASEATATQLSSIVKVLTGELSKDALAATHTTVQFLNVNAGANLRVFVSVEESAANPLKVRNFVLEYSFIKQP